MMFPRGAALAGALAIGMAAAPRARAQDPPPAPDAPALPPPMEEEVPEGALPAPAGDPTLRAGDPDPDEAPRRSNSEVSWGIGARLRYITTPTWMINWFVDHSTPMRSFSVAAEVSRRKKNFDIVLSFEYANVSPEDGLWLEGGDDPSQLGGYPDYVDFDGLALLSFDVSFVWHTPLTERVALRYGAGIGIGLPLGSLTHQDTACSSDTTIDDLDDPNACTPVPGRIDEGDIPPIVPIVNVLLGVRFKLVDQLSLQIEGGWRFPSFFLGGGVGYFF